MGFRRWCFSFTSISIKVLEISSLTFVSKLVLWVFLARAYEYGRQKVTDDYVDDEYSYQEYDFQGASGFSFGGVKADDIDGEESFLGFFPIHATSYTVPKKLAYFFLFTK